jgi:lipopolysaccharide transport system ATP-binding protein
LKAIKVENLSKAYQLGEIGTGTLSRDLERWFAKIRGKEDPFLKIGETNDRTSKGTSDVVWSLKDINFEIAEGDAVGIIGRNGAGKSTLLKILSRVTSPTTGNIKVKGRIASLLEVGTGFHPELTGRENIYLNGAILGMRKKEIAKQFDAIVDFSGVERYVDTPVKRYSSGMYVRLAFAVAAHLDSEILIVDEVLAVGDAEFQKKCLGKMGEVSKGQGRTVLFVSHNLNAVAALCNSGIFLKNGLIKFQGDAAASIKEYNNDRENTFSKEIIINRGKKKAWFSDFRLTERNTESVIVGSFKPGVVKVAVESVVNYENIYIGIGINDSNEVRLFTLFSKFYGKQYNLKPGNNVFSCSLDSIPLKPGNYLVELFVGTDYETLDYYSGLQIEIKIPEQIDFILPDSSQGSIVITQHWE